MVDLTQPLHSSTSILHGLPTRNTSAAERYGSRIKTAKVDRNQELFCKPWNDNRNNTGCTDESCQSRHACDVLLPNGTACDMDHRRTEHTGATVPLF